jgi:maltooligosyltrehalose trehalohydrolase
VRAGRQTEFSHRAPDNRTLPDPCDAATWTASRLQWAESELPAGRARSALLQRALEIRRQWITPYAGQLRTGSHTAERVGSRGLRVAWNYDDGRQWCLDANLGPDVEPSPGPAPRGVSVMEHRWTHDVPGSSSGWAPWSARWICLDAHS